MFIHQFRQPNRCLCPPSCQVCYTEGNFIQVRVHTEVLDPLTGQHNTTNVFHFTFLSDNNVPMIVPKSYGGEPRMSKVLKGVHIIPPGVV